MAARHKLASSALTLEVVLQCTKTEEVEEKVITFESFPATILDIKKQIEKQHSVPVCVQEISYDGHKVKDSVELSTMKVRNDDTFHIKYLAKGHCSEITDILVSLNTLLAAIEDKTPNDAMVLTEILSTMIDEKMLEDLSFKYFSPWLDSNTYVNKLHFVYYKGIEVIMKIYEVLLQVPQQDQFYIWVKYIENALLRMLWNFSETFPLRRLVIENKGIQMCTQSMLRVRLEEGKSMQEIVPFYTSQEQAIILETIVAAVGVLCTLSEMPDCHMEIASNEDVLHQLTCLSIFNGVDDDYLPPQIVATIFLCLAFTPDTHKHLTKPTWIRRLLDSCNIANQVISGKCNGTKEQWLLLKYLTMMFLAQIALASPHCVPQDYQQEITSEMRSFLETTHYQTVMDCEIDGSYVWSILLPFIKLVYIHETTEPMSKLQLTSLQLTIFGLQNMLGRTNHRTVLLKEGLLDYVMRMPQYVPASLRPQAEDLVQMVASAPDIPEGPPKLLNLVKASLAKMHFGLEQVLSLSVSEIVSKVLLT